MYINKSKIMTFRKEGGRRKREQWKWKGIEIEKMDHFKYLGYMLQRNNGTDKHIREISKKAISAMKLVWGIGQRKFLGDFKRRMWMFDHSVKSIITYGCRDLEVEGV